jgi:predicted enzyme related to lactoylglutathione lyase
VGQEVAVFLDAARRSWSFNFTAGPPSCGKAPLTLHNVSRFVRAKPSTGLKGAAVRGSVVHFQVLASQPDELAEFYRNVLGWSIRDARLSERSGAAAGPYRWIDPVDDAGVTGAIVDKKSFVQRPPEGAVIVVEVDDLSDALERVRQHGGVVLGPPDQLQLSGAGDADGAFTLAMFADPEGNQMALVAG